jgi:hypothetical protein
VTRSQQTREDVEVLGEHEAGGGAGGAGGAGQGAGGGAGGAGSPGGAGEGAGGGAGGAGGSEEGPGCLPTYAALAEELRASRTAHATVAATIERLSRQFSAFQHLAPGTPPSPAAPLLAPILPVLEAPALYPGRLVPDEAAAANPTLEEYRPKSMYAPKPFFGRFTDQVEPRDEDNVLRLVEDFEYFAVAHQAPPNFWVYLLRPHLAGSARDWYENHWYH